MRKLSLSILVVVIATWNAWAGSQTGADFLKIPVGARAMALAQSYTALAEGADAINWNVAGIASTQFHGDLPLNLSLSHEELFFQNKLDYLALSKPYKNMGMGLSILRLSYPSQDKRDINRNITGSFEASDLALGLSFAASWRGIRFGSQAKMIKQDLGSESATGAAVDFGIMTPTPILRLHLGAAIRNLGPSMKFIRESSQLPLNVSFGASYRMANPLIITADLNSYLHQDQTQLSIGTEFNAGNSVILRAGYLAKLATTITNNQMQETNRGTLGGISGTNAGLGFKFSNLTLDYAISPFGELGNVHTFTLNTTFGGPPRSQKSVDPDDLNPLSSPKPVTEDRKIMIFDQPQDPDQWWGNEQ